MPNKTTTSTLNPEFNMTPQEIVHELDKHIVGQGAAKRAVSIALRNRWRRMQLDENYRREITPKNILMIGPTGVGKTEIARRLASIAGAPFIKVEATKFTEVGYVGRDVETIIRDLMEMGIKIMRQQEMAKVKTLAEEGAEERVLDALLSPVKAMVVAEENDSEKKSEASPTRQIFRRKLRDGELDDKIIEVEIPMSANVEIMAPPGMEEVTGQIQSLFESAVGKRNKTRKMKVKDALKALVESEAAKLINEDEIKARALENVEQNGMVFLDEFDKIVGSGNRSGAEISREGVQRDLLPLVEGSTVVTKYGMVKTDHILFIASGAFQISKPSDLIPELQGRFPIRVELNALTAEDFVRILTEPSISLTEQYVALLKTEGVDIKFSDDGIQHIAQIAYQVNETTENIGARRLHTIMERLLEPLSFEAANRKGDKVVLDRAYVENQLGKLAEDEDLSRWIL